MWKRTNFLVPVIITLITGLILSFQTAGAATKMPSFSLEDVLTGKELDSDTFAGKSLLITFFATWCPPCIQEIPNLIEVHDEFGPKGFSVIGLSMDQGGSKVVKRLIEKKSINYPVMMADNQVTRDFEGIYGIPTSFLVNSRGNVVKKYTGYIPHSVLIKDIKQIIK